MWAGPAILNKSRTPALAGVLDFIGLWPISRVLSWTIIYLGRCSRVASSGTPTNAPHWKLQNPSLKYQRDSLHSRLTLDAWCLKFPVRSTGGTALHSRKDLAVSPCPCGQTRLCSHLVPYGRQALPATRLPAEAGECPDFPPREIHRAIAWPGSATIIPHHSLWRTLLVGPGERLYSITGSILLD